MQDMPVSTLFFFGCDIISNYSKSKGDNPADGNVGKGKEDNYHYAMKTGTGNLRGHLRSRHYDTYKEANEEHGWGYATTMTCTTGASNPRKLRDVDIPDFSPQEFIRALVRFIVADDQVSFDDIVFHHTLSHLQSIRVVECPEFRYLCMLLRESLVDADIPCRDKMRKAILKHWRNSFEELKQDLSVSLTSQFPFSLLTNFDH